MRAIAFFAVSVALAFSASAETAGVHGSAHWEAVAIPAAKRLDVRSAAGHDYRIFVAAPPGPTPPGGLPVIYVLDGNAAFPVAAFLARGMASRNEVTGLDAPLVVGIGYPGEKDFDVDARRRDYTVAGDTAGRPSEQAGGSRRFLEFIERELKPLMSSLYQIDPQRQALFGHSFGGLFVLDVLFNRPAAFAVYLASSPSIWWRDGMVMKNPSNLVALDKASALPWVQVSVGSREDDPPKGKLTPELRAMIASRRMIEPARELVATLRSLPGWSERVTFHELGGEDHGFVWMPAMTRGMQLFLERTAPQRAAKP